MPGIPLRRSHERFKAAWLRGNKDQGVTAGASIDAIDAILHRERVTPTGAKVMFEAQLDDLPDGVLVVAPDAMDKPLLVADGRLWAWSPAGYTNAGPRGKSAWRSSRRDLWFTQLPRAIRRNGTIQRPVSRNAPAERMTITRSLAHRG